MTVIAHSIAQAMADYENEHRYEGGPNTSPMVEPYEAGTEDFEEIAAFIAERLQGAVDDRGALEALLWSIHRHCVDRELDQYATAKAIERLLGMRGDT